jgi:hypothetical protein
LAASAAIAVRRVYVTPAAAKKTTAPARILLSTLNLSYSAVSLFKRTTFYGSEVKCGVRLMNRIMRV